MAEKPENKDVEIVTKIVSKTRQRASGDAHVQKVIDKVLDLSSKGKTEEDITREVGDELRTASTAGPVIDRLDIYV